MTDDHSAATAEGGQAVIDSGLIRLFRTIALEGEKYGIKANLLIFAFENMRLLYGR